WSIGSDTHSLSCHVGIADMRTSECESLLRRIRDKLADKFHIHHTTIQFEYANCEMVNGCVIPASPAREHVHNH
ncbi:MAG TPA: cation transporter, partial [Candidatus Bathyarchaeia archaeon]|nr:cation transporter [Candidatus Bathyarchaeia archaeon]